MFRTSREILADIDATIELLSKNGEPSKQISINPLFTSEMNRVDKIKQSVFTKLLYSQELLKNEKCAKVNSCQGIEKKTLRMGKLEKQTANHFAHRMKKIQRTKQPRIGRNRKKNK